MNTSNSINVWNDLLDVQVTAERLSENLEAYKEILQEIRKLRNLDLTDVHPCIIFEPMTPYRQTDKE